MIILGHFVLSIHLCHGHHHHFESCHIILISLIFPYASVLNSLNLPAAIEDVTGNSVPSSVLEKSRKIQELGGIQFIDGLMSELPELLQR